MDIQDLNVFVHVARNRSFSRAATQMRIAQSALSRRVGRLEHQLGVDLFVRHARGVGLTEAGNVLLERAERLVQEVQLIERDLLSLASEPTGKLTIALPPTTGQIVGPLLIAECDRLFPRLEIVLREGFSGSIHEWLFSGEVDLGLLYEPEHSADLEITPIVAEPLYLFAAFNDPIVNKYRNERGVPLKHLSDIPLILPNETHSIRRLLVRLAAERGYSLNIAREVTGTRITQAMVQAGLGYTVFSHAGFYTEVMNKTLAAIPLYPQITWHLTLVHNKNLVTSRAVSAVKMFLLQQGPAMIGNGVWRGRIYPQAAS